MDRGSHLDDAHAMALKAWRTKFPRGYMDHDDPFVVAIREELSSRSRPSEPRTCETCAKKKESCPDVLQVYGETGDCGHWTPRAPQSADVEMVREALKDGESALYSALMELDCNDSGYHELYIKRIRIVDALAALDRIVGKEE